MVVLSQTHSHIMFEHAYLIFIRFIGRGLLLLLIIFDDGIFLVFSHYV